MDKLTVGFGRAVLLATMLAGLAACGGGGDSNAQSSPSAANNPPPTNTPPLAESPPPVVEDSPPPVVADSSPPVVADSPPTDMEVPPVQPAPEEVVSLPIPQLKSVTLSWTAPTENTDGSALVNLSGYEIHYGTEPGHYTQTITVNNAGLNRYVVDNLESGTYFFALTALTSNGAKSNFSGEVSKTI